MNAFKKIKLTLTSIVSGMCFLGTIGLLVLFILKKTLLNHDEVYFVNNHSIFILFAIFFLFFLGIFVPIVRRIFIFLKIEKINPFDNIATISLFLVSFIPIIILSKITIFLLRNKKLEKHRYKILRISIFILLFLLGVIIRFHGERDLKAQINFENHTSLLDYFLVLLVNGITPKWNVISGINLSENKSTLEDKIISFTIGPVIREYSISVKRGDASSERIAMRKTVNCLANKEVVSVFLEGGRTPIKILLSGILLNNFDEGDAMLRLAFKRKILVQPIFFDFPAIWRGKNDYRWGIHPCIVDIYYLQSINPEHYFSFEEFKKACWNAMHDQLLKSKKIKSFQKKP